LEAIERDEKIFGPIPDDFKSSLSGIAKTHGHPSLASASHSPTPDPAVMLWGTGSPRREFLYSDDLADACIFLMERIDAHFSPIRSRIPRLNGSPIHRNLFNIGSGEDLTIRELSQAISSIVGFKGSVVWDETKPDGTPRKLLDIGRLTAMGWKPGISLEQGIRFAYQDYLSRLRTHVI
jgi:GDP-L-fucose synthase